MNEKQKTNYRKNLVNFGSILSLLLNQGRTVKLDKNIIDLVNFKEDFYKMISGDQLPIIETFINVDQNTFSPHGFYVPNAHELRQQTTSEIITISRKNAF